MFNRVSMRRAGKMEKFSRDEVLNGGFAAVKNLE
jgi:hypothetical protein